MKPTQFLILLLLWPLAGDLQALTARPDVRVVIDVSGSMKQNDPHNLRAPALKLLVGLLPDEARAGVWTFGRYVNMAVKYGPVNTAWKRRARQAAGQIHSRGLFTNIEEALRRASFNWQRPDPRHRRHLILLTDGMVDVSGDAALDQASRQRILTQLLPRLKRAGVRVHTVALSAAVDRDLLRRLSGETGGWYEQVASAEDLQRVFLRLFEKTAPRDALPIEANRFKVDAGIKDMTLLVFRPAGAPRLKLHTPAGEVWLASRVPGQVIWFQEQGYDLITVKQPMQGEWRLETPPDPDNRVMVATNLRLELAELPEIVVGDERLNVFAYLAQNGRRVRRTDFLQLVQFSLQQRAGSDPASSRDAVLQDRGEPPDRTAGDGIYSQQPGPLPKAGLQQLIVHADAATFQRERRHSFHYYPSLVQISLQAEAGSHRVLIRVRPEADLLDPASVRLEVRRPGAAPLKMTPQGNEWQLHLESQAAEAIVIHLQAQGRDGQMISRDYPQQLPGAGVSAMKTQAHATADEAAAYPAQPGDGDAEAASVDWKMLIGITLAINLFLLANGLLTHLYLKKRRARREAREVAELSL
jgi:uncharacterized protein (TIGR03503 family)